MEINFTTTDEILTPAKRKLTCIICYDKNMSRIVDTSIHQNNSVPGIWSGQTGVIDLLIS